MLQGIEDMTSNIVFIGAFALSVLLMVGSAALFRFVRKRGRRRSPLHGKKLENLPGQQLMKRVNDHGDDILASVMIMYFALPLMLGAWAIARVNWQNFRFGGSEALFTTAAFALFCFGLWRFVKYGKARSQAEDGLIAEQMTGQLLNRLIGPNCIVAHDLPCDGFNIDHIVIAPKAVYAIETKSFRKRRDFAGDTHYKVSYDGRGLQFPDWRETDAIEQARRQAQWLSRYLRDSLARDIPVIPALALPGWWIDTTDTGRQSDVRVFTPMGRGAHFLLSGNETLDSSMRALIAQAIAQKYPNVEA